MLLLTNRLPHCVWAYNMFAVIVKRLFEKAKTLVSEEGFAAVE